MKGITVLLVGVATLAGVVVFAGRLTRNLPATPKNSQASTNTA